MRLAGVIISQQDPSDLRASRVACLQAQYEPPIDALPLVKMPDSSIIAHIWRCAGKAPADRPTVRHEIQYGTNNFSSKAMRRLAISDYETDLSVAVTRFACRRGVLTARLNDVRPSGAWRGDDGELADGRGLGQCELHARGDDGRTRRLVVAGPRSPLSGLAKERQAYRSPRAKPRIGDDAIETWPRARRPRCAGWCSAP